MLDGHLEWLSPDGWVIVQIHPQELVDFNLDHLVEFDRRWDMFAAAADPAILDDYRAKLALRRKTVKMLNFGRSPFTKKNRD